MLDLVWEHYGLVLLEGVKLIPPTIEFGEFCVRQIFETTFDHMKLLYLTDFQGFFYFFKNALVIFGGCPPLHLLLFVVTGAISIIAFHLQKNFNLDV